MATSAPIISPMAEEIYGHLLRPIPFFEKWNFKAQFYFLIYFSICVIGALTVPNVLWDPRIREITVVIGILGIWRFGWWFMHGIRAYIYAHARYPVLRDKAEKAWAAGQGRPKKIHVMMTTFKERQDVTELVMDSIIREVRSEGIPAVIWLGSGDDSDEIIIEEYLRKYGSDCDIELVISRQKKGGKRYAIGTALRAMRLANVEGSEPVVFMDGDSIWGPGMLHKCISLFAADPELQAVTTDEEVICYGPKWMAAWLDMRFSQRRIAMQSHSLSNKVITLTGRLSLFRAYHVTNPKFITTVEDDYLFHWLWGRFRFLSGDDKSTWYYMLTQGAKMLYVPDALAITIEHIEGNGYDRMVQNLRRWSGNMLRNGARAIKLGPKKVGFFIWWCIIDQRIAMWTMLVSPILAILTAILFSPVFIGGYFVWLLLTRLIQALFLFSYARTVDASYPILLYVNQLTNAAVKVYSLFRLSKQRWTNRGNQSAGFSDSWLDNLRNLTASYMTFVSMSLLVICLISYAQLVDLPSRYMLRDLIGFWP